MGRSKATRYVCPLHSFLLPLFLLPPVGRSSQSSFPPTFSPFFLSELELTVPAFTAYALRQISPHPRSLFSSSFADATTDLLPCCTLPRRPSLFAVESSSTLFVPFLPVLSFSAPSDLHSILPTIQVAFVRDEEHARLGDHDSPWQEPRPKSEMLEDFKDFGEHAQKLLQVHFSFSLFELWRHAYESEEHECRPRHADGADDEKV
jgi:hypothetical protein